jgi:hypothetical protein
MTLSSTSVSPITVTATGTAVSSTAGDVKITATADGQTSDPFSLSTRRPFKTVSSGISQQCDTSFGFDQLITYQIQDNLGTALPSSIGVNEHFTTGVVPDFPGANWRPGSEVGSTTDPSLPANFGDLIMGENVNATPAPVPRPVCSVSPPLIPSKVDHRSQEWRVGSPTIGVGTRVQTDTLQRFNEHIEHDNILTGGQITP